jgi:plasmid maintenance system antidote protein VapI
VDRCPKCNAECERSCDGDLIAATIDDNRLRNQLAAYRALLVEAHRVLVQGGNGVTDDLLTRIETVIGKDGDEK